MVLALLQAHDATPRAETIDPESLAGIYFTGGTTGRPKGVMLSQRSFVFTYYMELLDFDLGWHETFVFATPLTHAAGCLLLPVLLRQGRCVILDHFEPDLLLGTIERRAGVVTNAGEGEAEFGLFGAREFAAGEQSVEVGSVGGEFAGKGLAGEDVGVVQQSEQMGQVGGIVHVSGVSGRTRR